MFGSGRDIVKSLDPDAPFREKRPLHDLDMEDQLRLSKQIFVEIRQGKIEEAQTLCEHCGQPWRAAILEGWRLHHDPNYDNGDTLMKDVIEGNPHRDIWKKCAWMMADNKQLDEYSRAIAGVFCGHLESLLSTLNDSWVDLLWSYLKVQIDIRVESEIRSCKMKNFLKMPDQYWNSKMSLEQIFDELAAHKNPRVVNAANSPVNITQKYIILDDFPELVRQMNVWVADERISPQMLRFLTHVVMFMRQIGRQHQEDIGDKVIKSYVECLIKMGDPQLVAFYTAALPSDMQTVLYSRFMDTLNETAIRKRCLEEAINAGLDVGTITTYTVETIRNLIVEDVDNLGELNDKISEDDDKKISALEWLTFYPQQKNELLNQANSLIRSYLAERKISCVRKAFDMISQDSINQIVGFYGSMANLPYKESCCIKEYLSHQAYLSAIDSYNDWVQLYHSKPKEPRLAKSGANFTEKIASEHKEQAYKSELESWKQSLDVQKNGKIRISSLSKNNFIFFLFFFFLVTKELLYNILLFPEKGWLVDPECLVNIPDDDLHLYKNRAFQMEHLRKIYIPEIVSLLHNVLHLAGEYKECVHLADELVSESRQLYQSFSKHKLAEVLIKISESSLALMNEKSDPWGYTSTAST